MSDEILPTGANESVVFPPSRFAQAKILIVDDAPFNIKLIDSRLTASGYKNLHHAVDGLDALEKTIQLKPDLILLDIMMPNLDGFGCCERIRADTTIDRMPIIIQTALGDRESKLRGLSCGADDFINKPLDLDEVNLRVKIHLERYFMLQDLQQMQGYLRMELEHAKNTIKQLEETLLPNAAQRQMSKHYEVLETVAGLSIASIN